MPHEKPLSLPEIEALSLTEAAVRLDHARHSRHSAAIVAALDHNLVVWTAVRTIANRSDVSLTRIARINLIRLADYIATTTLCDGAAIADPTVNTLININLQISEGLLEGAGLVPRGA